MKNTKETVTLIEKIIIYSKRILEYIILHNQVERTKARFGNLGVIISLEESFKLQFSIIENRKEEILLKCKCLMTPLFKGYTFKGYDKLENFRLTEEIIRKGYMELDDRYSDNRYILFLYPYKDSVHDIKEGELYNLNKVSPILWNYEREIKSHRPNPYYIPSVFNDIKNYYAYRKK